MTPQIAKVYPAGPIGDGNSSDRFPIVERKKPVYFIQIIQLEVYYQNGSDKIRRHFLNKYFVLRIGTIMRTGTNLQGRDENINFSDLGGSSPSSQPLKKLLTFSSQICEVPLLQQGYNSNQACNDCLFLTAGFPVLSPAWLMKKRSLVKRKEVSWESPFKPR